MLVALALTAAVASAEPPSSESSPPAFVQRSLPAGLAMPIPTPQQLQYQGEISALIHFGMATFFHDVRATSLLRAPVHFINGSSYKTNRGRTKLTLPRGRVRVSLLGLFC
jgi:hypothetical protein